VVLILEVSSPNAATLGGAARQTFDAGGGSIGRDQDNSWVLPHSKVSGHHARISFADGVYYIEDTSRNGVCLNSSRNRLERGRPHPLASGDRLLIDPYEIRVALARDEAAARDRRTDPPRAADPFAASYEDAGDPFAPGLPPDSGFDAPEPAPGDLDPLVLLNLHDNRPKPRKAPSADDLRGGSLLDEHYRPPAVVDAAPARAPANDPSAIPHDYDPLAPDEPVAPPEAALKASPEATADSDPRVLRPRPGSKQASVDVRPAAPAAPLSPAPPSSPAPSPSPAPPSSPAPASGPAPQGGDLAAVLEGAGLEAVAVTPELAQAFGRIIRVVVSGVMDVLQSRQQIKDEFRMRMTRFKPGENNPLKFSANVDDALHNLLVKRNPAYLGPVEAFEDAFSDLRNHQLAMLAGMRVAFESLLAEFDPDRLQEEFDRQLSKGLVPAKLRYWDLYREKRHEMVKDPDAAFRELFAEAFARAYEEQLRQLKSRDDDAPGASSRPKHASDS